MKPTFVKKYLIRQGIRHIPLITRITYFLVYNFSKEFFTNTSIVTYVSLSELEKKPYLKI